jgi:hypothetical protein
VSSVAALKAAVRVILAVSRSSADKYELVDHQFDPNWKNLGDIEVVVLHFWVAGHYDIKSFDPKFALKS